MDGTGATEDATSFGKDKKLIYVITGPGTDGLVKDAGNKNFIILITGDDVSS